MKSADFLLSHFKNIKMGVLGPIYMVIANFEFA